MNKWEQIFANLKSAFNTKFGTEMGEDTSPEEMLDVIDSIEANSEVSQAAEAAGANAEAIQALTDRMDRHDEAMRALETNLEELTNQLTELAGAQVTEAQLSEISTSITGLESEITKVKMSYTAPGKNIQQTAKPGQEAKTEQPKDSVSMKLSLHEILTGEIRN